MRLHHSLSFKIVVVLVFSLVVVLVLTALYNIEQQKTLLIRAAQVSAERTSNFAKKAVWTGMKKNHPEEIWSTIGELGKEPGLTRIRIYDKRGVIRYSTVGREAGTIVNANTDACTMCHGTSTEFTKTSSDQYARVYSGPNGERILGFINPIRNERTCWDAPCHAHHESQTFLGVMDVQISLASVDAYIASSTNLFIISLLLSLAAVALVSWLFIYTFVHKRVQKFIAGTEALAAGDMTYRIAIQSRDELGELANSFNSMAEDLRTAKAELITWSSTLEEKVKQKTRELQEVQGQVLHMEKMASLGKLSSMIAHELNNPLSGILTYAKLIRKRLTHRQLDETSLAEIVDDITLISDEAKRCGDIVRNLLYFARTQTGQLTPIDVHEIINKVIRLLKHQIDLQQISVQMEVPDDGIQLVCDTGQIQQALVALTMNAVEAMPDGGQLTMGAEARNERVILRVRDTGSGIPAEEMQRIFEPFYTTKESGHGTGLGLSIVYGIVRNHKGDVRVSSEPGLGTTFTIDLPRDPGQLLQASDT